MVPGAGPRQIPAIQRLDVVPARLYVRFGFSVGDISCISYGFLCSSKRSKRIF